MRPGTGHHKARVTLSLRTRVGVPTILGVMLIFAFLAWQGSQAMETSTQMILQERLTLARAVALHVDEILTRILDHLARTATLPAMDLEDRDLGPEKAALRVFFQNQPYLFSYVFLLDGDGLVLWTEPYQAGVVGVRFLACPHVQEALRPGGPGFVCMAPPPGGGGVALRSLQWCPSAAAREPSWGPWARPSPLPLLSWETFC